MKKTSALILCFIVIALFEKTYAQANRKTVFIIVDGIPADVIEKLAPPNLNLIKKEGGYTRSYVGGKKGTYSQTPTISAVGYNSLLTGTWVNKHNVWGNDIKDPNYSYHTIFRYFKEQYPQKKAAIFSTWLDNRTKLVGDSIAATGYIPLDYHYDGLELDTAMFPHDKDDRYINDIDEVVSRHAADYIKTDAPDLTWVYLQYTDDMGHMYGDSPQFYDAINEADKRIGYILQAIQYRRQQFNEDWMIVVTTDHGRTASSGKGHGGQSDRERSGWIFTNAKDLNEEFHQPQASITDIMPSIARFMNINIPEENAREVDGIPFTGKLSFINPSFHQKNNSIEISWAPVHTAGDVKIWISRTNHFKTGGKDEYTLAKTITLSDGHATLLLDDASAFYKVVLEAKYNTYNFWVNAAGAEKQP